MKLKGFKQSSALVQNLFLQKGDDQGFDNYNIIRGQNKNTQQYLVDRTNQQYLWKDSKKKIEPWKNQFIKETKTVDIEVMNDVEDEKDLYFKVQENRKISQKNRQNSQSVMKENLTNEEILQQPQEQFTPKQILNPIKNSPNLCLNFDNSSSSSSEEEQTYQLKQELELKKINFNENISIARLPQCKNDKKKEVLLMKFDDQSSSQSEQHCSQAQKQVIVSMEHYENQEQFKTKPSLIPSNKKSKPNIFLKNFSDSDSDSKSQSQDNTKSQRFPSQPSRPSITRPITIFELSNHSNDGLQIYQPIPQNCVLQSIVKRYLPDYNNYKNNVVYQMFDSMTYKSILKVRKVSEGFQIFISKDGGGKVLGKSRNITTKNIAEERSCALVCSNFFGTQFNCFQFNRNIEKSDCTKLRRLITVDYETNFLGLKGPRKMEVYIPVLNSIVESEKGLQDIYSQQQSLDPSKQQIQRFINRTPRWNSLISSFVLNFEGRATVSSVKNFIITSEQVQKKVLPNESEGNFVIFGKIEKNVFNLDVKYPFSLVQGLALALSSFDKKLGCQ